MASNITAQTVLAEISQGHLECPICSERFKQPKLLECSHSFCLECLQQLREKGPSRAKLSCPVCRQETLLKGNGIDSLITDFSFVSLLEAIQTQEKRLKWQQEQQVPNQGSGSKCSKHTEKDLIMYCEQCKKLMCTTCIAKDHRKHPAMELDEALDKSKHHAEQLLTKVRQRIQTFNIAIQEIDRSRKTLDSMFVATKEKISKKADEEFARIKAEKHKLTQEAEKIYRDRVTTMETARAINSKEVTTAASNHKVVNQLMDYGSCCEIVSHLEKIQTDLKEYRVMQPRKLPDGMTYMNFREVQKTLGRLLLKGKWTLKTEKNMCMNIAQQKDRFSPVDVAVYSNGDIVVPDFNSNCLTTVSADGNTQSTLIPQALSNKGLTKPSKVVVNKNDELIVLDNGTVKIFNRNYKLLHQFIPGRGSDDTPTCVGVDKNGLIAVSYPYKSEISLHQPDGSRSRTLPAPGIGGYLTTYKQQLIYTKAENKSLVSVDYSGNKIFSEYINQSLVPGGVCFDEDGSIYVAVREGLYGEIHHYSPYCKYIGCIIKVCDAPCGITFTPSGDLVVATQKSIQVYHHE